MKANIIPFYVFNPSIYRWNGLSWWLSPAEALTSSSSERGFLNPGMVWTSAHNNSHYYVKAGWRSSSLHGRLQCAWKNSLLMLMILMLPVAPEKHLLLPLFEVEQCCSVCAKKSYSSSCKMEHKSRSLNISCDSIRLKSVSGTEEMKEKSRATFLTKRYYVHFKKEDVPVRSHYVTCANIRVFSLHSLC